ncbi:cytidylyltransferase family-domain-containing protein [Phascolomyces articulosus]|uniref:Phosphatidate cytidylyltransferase n=1 Tax=Phascolomyces articulosus TaxID=60185 RepID=A0AAD5PD24_9FUNG|nr:cytidylyltransferase family-domain-containing protein [Phascolomyces articulosus]
MGGKRRAGIMGHNNNNRKMDTSSQQQHNVTDLEEEKEPVMLAAEASSKKWKNWWIRTITTFMMIGAFFTILASGHMWIILMVTAIQIIVYGEVVQIAQAPAKESQVRWYKTLSWYFFVSAMYFLYGESIIYYFQEIILVDAFLLPFATHHRFISFVLYVIGFVFFVANLRKGLYKRQFAQFGWTHMALILIVVQSHFIVNNILEGLIWFVLPVSLVICNDIFAYVCGFFWGRTQLIKLSPKKTVEGFLGAWLCTLVFGFLWATLLMHFNYFTCPAKDLATSAWTAESCEPRNPVFTFKSYAIPEVLASVTEYTGWTEVWIAPIQIHALIMACFASLIAPFGGFFASGVKRAFNIKDFGQSIPGHGGMTDRMDCQFLMGLFASIYYTSFIKTHSQSVGQILALVVGNLSTNDQLELLERLLTFFVNNGVLHESVLEKCGASALLP